MTVRRPVLVLIAILLLGAPLVALIVLAAPSTEWLLVTGTALVLVVGALFRLRGGIDPLDPYWWISSIYGLIFVGHMGGRIYRSDFIAFNGLTIMDGFVTVLVMGLVGACGFVAGYVPGWWRAGAHSTVSPEARNPSSRPDPGMLLTFAFVFLAAAVAIYLAWILQSGGTAALSAIFAPRSEDSSALFGSTTSYISSAPLLAWPAALLFIYVSITSKQPIYYLFAGLAIAWILLLHVSIGDRRSLVLPILSAGFAILIYRGVKLRMRWLLVLLPLIIIFGIQIPREARNVVTRQNEGGLVPLVVGTLRSPIDSIDHIVNGSDTEQGPALALVVQTQGGSYANGRATLRDLAASPIPRMIWPDKPVTEWDEFLIHVWGQPCTAVGGFCPTLSGLGSLWMDWGYLGVGGGMFLFGVFWRGLYERLCVHGRGRRGLNGLFFAGALPYSIMAIWANTTLAIMWCSWVIAPLVLARVVTRHRGPMVTRPQSHPLVVLAHTRGIRRGNT